jgi:flagellar M-ring protein FliF
MDFLNKAFAQFNDLFRSMTPGGRITTGLLLIVAVASVGYLFQAQVGGGDDYLFGGEAMQTPTLQKMEEAFGKANLNGYSLDGGRVKVPHSQRAAYLAALADARALPTNFGDAGKEAVDGNMWESPAQRERRLEQAKEAELVLVIRNMKGVEQASVIIDKQNQPGFDRTPLKTASVTVWGAGADPLDEDLIDKIAKCVKAANAGMKDENVTIIDGNAGGVVHIPGDPGGPDGDPHARAVRKAEQALNAKIREALMKFIPNIAVASTVELGNEKGGRIIERKNDPKGTPIKTSEKSRTSNHESSSAGGAPGLGAQGGGAMASASLSGKGNENTEETDTQQLNVVSTTSKETEMFGLALKSAKASIGIPASYYTKVWQDRNPAKEGEQAKKPDEAAIAPIRQEIMEDVRKHVAALLPGNADVKDPTALVQVTTFQDIKMAEVPSASVAQTAVSWFKQNWTMVALVGLVLFSLNMLRSMLRSLPAPAAASIAPSPIAARVSAADSKTEETVDSVEATAARRLRRISGSGPSLRDELSEFVKEDPDSAANILRAWIGQVT